jgi:hypothetical protein
MEKETMTQKTYTEDLGDFGYIELDVAADLLKAWSRHGLPKDFKDSGVKIAMNLNSGYVFLTNDEYQVAMRAIDQKSGEIYLYSYYSSPYEGREGSLEDLQEQFKDMHPEDKQWFKELKESVA